MSFALGQLLLAGVAFTAAWAAREKVVKEHNPGSDACPSDTVQAWKAIEKDFVTSAGLFRGGPPCTEECPRELPTDLRNILGIWVQQCSGASLVYLPVPDRCAGMPDSTTGLMAELDSEVVQLVSCNPAHNPYSSIEDPACRDATQQLVAGISAWMQTHLHAKAQPGQASDEAADAIELLMQASPSLMEVAESYKQTEESDNWPLYWSALDLSPNLQDCIFTVPMAALLTVAANAGLLHVGFKAFVGLYKVITHDGALDTAAAAGEIEEEEEMEFEAEPEPVESTPRPKLGGKRRVPEPSVEPEPVEAEEEGERQWKRARKEGGAKLMSGNEGRHTKRGSKAVLAKATKPFAGRARDDDEMEA